MKRVLSIIVLLTLVLIANDDNTTNISKTFWSKGYFYESKNDYANAYKSYLISANQIDVKNNSKDFDTNYILWSIEAIRKILKNNPELSIIKDELDYWNFKLINSKIERGRNPAIFEIYNKAKGYENKNDFSNAYKYYLILAKQIDTLRTTENFTENYILWSIKSIRQIIEKKPKLSTIKNEDEYWTSKLANSKSENARNMDISDTWNKGNNYKKIGDYKNAYKYYLKAAKMDNNSYYSNSSMINIAQILKVHKELSTVENEIEYWLLKAVEKNPSDSKNFAISFLENYYEDTNQTEKRKLLMQKMYMKYNNLEMGCKLSSVLYFDKKYIEAFDLAKQIYENNPSLPKWNNCVRTLSYLYQDGGGGIAKNIDKAINLLEKYFTYSSDDYFTAKDIASLYLKEKKDYANAKKWYKTAYELHKDEKYLTAVENYIKSQPIYNIEEKVGQALFPVITHPILSKNIMAQTGAYKDHYGFFSTSNKDILITDDYFSEIKTLRGWIGSDLSEGIINSMSYDENNKLLYVTGINSQNDLNKNDIIKVFDISTGKIVKTLNNSNSYTPMNISISRDGNYLLALNNSGSNINVINTSTNEILNFKAIEKNYTYGVIKKQQDDYMLYILDEEYFINIFSLKKERLIERRKFDNLKL